jgi:hypothetical protein
MRRHALGRAGPLATALAIGGLTACVAALGVLTLGG